MLRIIIKEFRCWKNLKIDIPLGEVTLIKGSSGCGKSTILQAIVWCLYGKIQLVSPIIKKTASTEVKIEFPFNFDNKNGIINITRTKSTRVTFTHDKHFYDDKVAQAVINDLFGTYDLWLASCYVGQGTRNTFLTAPNSGKMELLNSIAFHEEDPKIFIDKISNSINENDIIYNNKLSEYNTKLSNLEKLMSEINFENVLSSGQHEFLNYKIKELNTDIVKLSNIKKQYEIDIKIIESLTDQLLDIEDVIIPEPDNDLIILADKYDYNYEEYDFSSIIVKLKQIRELLKFGSINNDVPLFTKSDYMGAVNKEIEYNTNYDLLSSLGIICHYNQQSIDQTIKIINYLIIRKEYTLLTNINTKYTDCNDLISSLNAINKSIKEKENSFDIESLLKNIIEIPNYSKYETVDLDNKLKNLYHELSQPLVNDREKDILLDKNNIKTLNIKLSSLYQNDNIIKLKDRLAILVNDQNKLDTEIQKLLLSIKTLKCPKCNESLKLENNNLVMISDQVSKYESLLLIKKDSYNDVAKEISLVNKNIQEHDKNISEQINAIKIQIKLLESTLLIYEKEYINLKIERDNRINSEINIVRDNIKKLKHEQELVKFNYEKLVNNTRTKLLKELRTEISNMREESNKLNRKIEEISSLNEIYLNNLEQKNILEAKLKEYGNIEYAMFDKYSIDDLKIKLSKLINIKIIDKVEYSSEFILKCIDYKERKDKYLEIIKEIPSKWANFITDINLIDDINKFEEHNKLIKITNYKKSQIEKTKVKISNQIDNIKKKILDDPSDTIEETTKLLSYYKDVLNLSIEANKVVKFKNDLTSEREILVKMNNKLANLRLLKQYGVETECKNLNDVISSINSSIDNVCESLFDKDISIILSLFKTIKTTKNVKPTVNFQISYKGGIFDNINQLSGGEGDRASVALTLALYRLSSFPLLMLDETLASLHHDMKESVVETLNNIIDKNRCVIIVLHDCVDGVFDNVIDLEEIDDGKY